VPPAEPTGAAPERVVVIGTGAIAVCHLPALVTSLRHQHRIDTAVCLTRSARDLVSPSAVAALTGRPVIPHEWSASSGPVHVQWADWAQAVLVWPATLHFLGRCANGLSADVASSIVLATRAPVLYAPSVASGAARGGPFRRAVRTLRDDGATVVGPVLGHSVSDWRLSEGACAPPDVALAELLSLGRAPGSDPSRGGSPRLREENHDHRAATAAAE
jgi:phosphopantothenoylcysteine decarboxylase / phosphopantothenate---cysteine ligase